MSKIPESLAAMNALPDISGSDSERLREFTRVTASEIKAVGGTGAGTTLEMIGYIRELESTNTALREQLARCEGSRRVHELDNHHNALACGYCAGPLKDEITRLQSQLARVEKERDDAREMVTMMTTEKQRVEQNSTSRCVEKVEAMADEWTLLWQKDLTGDHGDKHVYAMVARKIAKELKTLPTGAGEQEK